MRLVLGFVDLAQLQQCLTLRQAGRQTQLEAGQQFTLAAVGKGKQVLIEPTRVIQCQVHAHLGGRRQSLKLLGRGQQLLVLAGEQYSTINKDTRVLVKQAIDMVKALQKGDKPQVNDTKSYNNGVKVVPAFLLPPVIVTKENAAKAYANDPVLAPLTK